MESRFSRRFLSALGCFLLAALALGQATPTATLTGKVTAEGGTGLPGVLVTATSPNLPPGVYALRFEQESRRPYVREGIELRAEQTLRLNVQLLPETLGGDVVVIGTPPVVDFGSTRTGLVPRFDPHPSRLHRADVRAQTALGANACRARPADRFARHTR